MGLQLFFLYLDGFQENDGDTLLIAIPMSYKAQIYIFFLHVDNHCLSPSLFKPIYLF